MKGVDLLRYGGTGGIQSVMEKSPGIIFVRSGSTNGQVNIRGRSTQRSYSLTTLDGVPVLGRNTLMFNIMDPNAFDSIEIIRGAASSMYGSDAINGVINLVSRRYRGDISKDFSLDTKIRALEYATVNNMIGGRLEVLGGGDGFDVLFGLNGRTGGNFQTPEGEAKNSEFKSYGFDFNIGYTNSADTRFYTQGRYARAVDSGAGGQFANGGADYGSIRRRYPIYETYIKLGVELYDLPFAEKLDAFAYYRGYETELFTGFYTRDGRGGLTNTYNLTNQHVRGTKYAGLKLAFSSLVSSHSLDYGIETLSSLNTKVIPPTRFATTGWTITPLTGRKSQQHTFSAYIKDDFALSNSFTLTAALRNATILTNIGPKLAGSAESATQTSRLDEKRNDVKNAFTGNIGANFHFNEFFSLYGDISHNFKTASVSGIFAANGAAADANPILNNPDLKYETAQSYELGIRLDSQDHFFSLSAYQTNHQDMISLVQFYDDPTNYSNGYQKYANIGKTYIRGVELAGEHKFYGFTYAYNATHTYGHDQTNNRPLREIPPLFGRISLQYDLPFGYIKVQERAYQGRTRIDPTNERKTKSYAMSDAYLGLDLGYFNKEARDMELTLGVENIFNKRGVNPAAIEDITVPKSKITNPLIEPGTNFFIKYGYKY
nr:TonB-dependent receptor [Campylobacter troglodytis]